MVNSAGVSLGSWEDLITRAISDANPPRPLPSDPLWCWWYFVVEGKTFIAAGRTLRSGEMVIVSALDVGTAALRAGEVERSLVAHGLVPARPA